MTGFGLQALHDIASMSRVSVSSNGLSYLRSDKLISSIRKACTMNKTELIEALAKQERLTIKTAEEVVHTVFKEMGASLTNGKRIEIRGLGSFAIKHYEGYVGTNPRRAQQTTVESKNLPIFKVGKELRDRIDNGE